MGEACGCVALKDLAATEALGRRIGASLRAGEIVALEGPLGSGKTSMVRAIASGMGIDAQLVTSPSFILMQRYPGESLGLVHIDAWRMHGAEDLASLGLEEVLAGARDAVAVEWASRVAGALPAPAVRITLSIDPAGGRTAQIDDQRPRCGGALGDSASGLTA